MFGPESGGDFTACPPAVPLPDVIVGIAGCHYEFEDQTFTFDPAGFGWGHKDADVVLVAGSDDDVCAAWQSEDATDALQADGYNANLVTVDGVDHLGLIFHAVEDGEFVTLTDDPGGTEVVQTILDAINAATP